MPFYRGLDIPGDLQLTEDGRDLKFGTEQEAVLQKLRVRFGIFKGSWRYDRTKGLPYFDEILVAGPQLPLIQRRFYDTIIGTPGVDSVLLLRLRIEGSTLSVDFSVSAGGNTISDTFDFSAVA